MAKNILHREINKLLERIRQRHDALSRVEGKLPHLEIDLLLSDLRTLYEFCHELEHINDDEPAVKEMATDPALLVPGATHGHKDKPVQAESMETIEEKIVAKEPVPPQVIQPPPANLFGEGPTVGGRFEDKATVKDKVGARQSPSVASKLKQTPISDLRSSIGINEKFIFLNELFEGDSAEYNDTIEKLNACATYQEAESLLKSGPAARHNWNIRNKFVRADFWDLVQRRFMQA